MRLRGDCITRLILVSLLFIGPLAGKPSLKASQQSVSIVVEATDSAGLDSLEVTCPEADSTYHTNLSRAEIEHQFKRSFILSELFPTLKESKEPVRIKVTVRNTRGETASTTLLVQPNQKK